MTNPGETEAEALKRQIKMHEFLMEGGVAEGRDASGTMIYGDPIVVSNMPAECPFHTSEECVAWVEIKAGRGQWTRLELELEALTAERVALIAKTGTFDKDDVARSNELAYDILQVEQKLANRPSTAKQLRERPVEHVYAKAPNQGKPGNPWDRDKHESPHIAGWKNGKAYDQYGNPMENTYGGKGWTQPKSTSDRDTRNVVDAAAASLSEHEETITFDAEDDDEGE